MFSGARAGMRGASGSGSIAVGRPVTLTYDNGEGLEFRVVMIPGLEDGLLFPAAGPIGFPQ